MRRPSIDGGFAGNPRGIHGRHPRIDGQFVAITLQIDGPRTDDEGMAILRLGPLTGSLSGTSGNSVYVRSAYGTILRTRPLRFAEASNAQTETRLRMSRVSTAWRALTIEQAAEWRRYARTLAESQNGPGEQVPVHAQNLFVRLGMKVLQIDPLADVPLEPPSTPFLGDAVLVSVSPIEGALRFTASSPNAEGIVTELLTQRLPSVHCRTYLSRYRSQGFVAFGGEAVDVPAPRGVVAVAYRFVRAGTGQETALAELGVVQVP